MFSGIKKIVIGLFVVLLIPSCDGNRYNTKELDVINHCSSQLHYSLLLMEDNQNTANLFPKSVENNKLVWASCNDLTSGYYPGILWLLYEITKNEFWSEKALHYTERIVSSESNMSSLDKGLMLYQSYGNAHRIANKKYCQTVLLKAVDAMVGNFDPELKFIRNYESDSIAGTCSVSIKSILSLELLFWAHRTTNKKVYKDVAIKHVNTILKYHFRTDNSVYQVVNFDSNKGIAIGKLSGDGYSDDSAWARGQAICLYGFTMAYRETKMQSFLIQAEKIAHFIIDHPRLPIDKIPYWDFDAPGIPLEPRDASAAAMIASALYELSQYSADNDAYAAVADSIIRTLINEGFSAREESNYGFILQHSTCLAENSVLWDVPSVYADYYFLEALKRKWHRKYEM